MSQEPNHKNKSFGLLFGLIFFLIGVFQFIRDHHFYVFFVIASVVFFTVALIRPLLLQPVRKSWERLGNVLGIINTYLLLILIYFLLFMPYGLIIRLLRKDPLRKKIDLKSPSYWEITGPEPGNSLNFQF
jgi:hypothetical protein